MAILNPNKTGRIISILILILLIFSLISAILFTNNTNSDVNPDANIEILEEKTIQSEANEYFTNNDIKIQEGLISHSSNHFEFTPNYYQSPLEQRTRDSAQFDYDLRIKTINITYPGLTRWIVTVNNIDYHYFIIGGVDEPSFIKITLENFGIQDISSAENVIFKIQFTDFYGHTSWERQEYLGHFSAKKVLILDYTWIPTYSNYFILTCNLSFQKDNNQTNNLIKIYNLYTKKWGDNLEDGNINDWSGDLSSDKWHLTDSVEDDPNPLAHSSNYTFYHGLEKTGEKDDYGEDNDFELITPEIDLRRFDVEKDVYLYFKYYANSSLSDDLTVEGYKSSDQTWNLITVEFKDITLNKTNEPTWWIPNSTSKDFIPHAGMDIDSYAGELAKFKFRWHSDKSPENQVGFYLDDFFIYGFEKPKPEYEVGIESIEIVTENDPIMAGQKCRVIANITNYGAKNVFGLIINATVTDFSNRSETIKTMGSNTIKSLKSGESKTIQWEVVPSVAGIYYATVSVDFALDEDKDNNEKQSEGLKVLKYYSSFESYDSSWVAEPGWTKVQLGAEDPNPTEHSWSDVWYVGNVSTKMYDQNMSTCLYSPIIDLDGAQVNNLYKNKQINIGFKWFGEASNNDVLYFEYALDHTDDWSIFYVSKNIKSQISGDKSDKWYSWDTLGAPELFDHHIQFRWRFESDLEAGLNERGFYIDDFFVWVIQEQYPRPIITWCQVTPNAIINDSYDMVVLKCRVTSPTPLADVYVNLTNLNGPSNQILFNDGTHGDNTAGDNEFAIDLTAAPSVPTGVYILKITAMDKQQRLDNNYVKLVVRENLPPEIIQFTPKNTTLEIAENENIFFSVKAIDPEGERLTYSWFINSDLIIGWNEEYYKFQSEFHGKFSNGNYSLKVIVADNGHPSKIDTLDWNIRIRDVLPDLQVNDKDLKIMGNGESGNNVTENSLVTVEVWVHNIRPPTENNVSVHFIQQSTNVSIEDKIFKIHNISTFPGNESTLISVVWQADLETKYIKVWVDPLNAIIEINEENNEAVIPVNVSKSQQIIPPENGTLTNTTEVSYSMYIIAGGIIATILSFSFAIGTEIGTYRLFSMFAPLYYRVTGDKVLEHELRSKIYMHIRAHPGDHYRSIMTKLKLKNGTLVHHLSRLEQEELIRSERDGYFKRFYPVGMRIPKSEVGMYYPEGVPTYNIGEHQVSEIQLRIIKTLRKHPGATQKEIAKWINESRRVVNYHIKLLEQHGITNIVKSGRTTQCYVVEKYTSS